MVQVDENGVRVLDPAVARVTLVVDESFVDFKNGLNAEYEATGDGSGPDVGNADTEIVVRRRPERFLSEEFAELWKRIRYRARYRVTLDASVLPAAVAASEGLDDLRFIAKRANVIQTGELKYDEQGNVVTSEETIVEDQGVVIKVVGQRMPDLLRLIDDHLLATKFPLQLRRHTIAAIVEAVPTPLRAHALDDPERWARIVAEAIRVVTIEQLVAHIAYELDPDSESWDAEVVFIAEDEQAPPPAAAGSDPQRGVVEARPGGSNLFDHTIYDSHVERNFAAQLDNDTDHVSLFTKLPRRFKIPTPVGEYSPDWAIAYADGAERLYLVRETKDTLDLNQLTWDEAMRIRFAHRHFVIAPAGPVDYQVTTDSDGLRIASNWDDAID